MRDIISLFRLIITPHSGWVRIFQQTSRQRLERNFFFPLLALLSVSAIGYFWQEPTATLIDVLVRAILFFTAYFIGYLAICGIINAAAQHIFVKEDAALQSRIKYFSMYCLSILILSQVVQNLLPAPLALLDLFPLYLLIIIWQSLDFFEFKKDRNTYFFVGSFILMTGVPYLIFTILDKIVP